jgi:hypothetical protein
MNQRGAAYALSGGVAHRSVHWCCGNVSTVGEWVQVTLTVRRLRRRLRPLCRLFSVLVSRLVV